MAKIQTEIVMQDNFSPVWQNMLGFINLAMGSMLQMLQTLNQPFEAALQGMQDGVSQAEIAGQAARTENFQPNAIRDLGGIVQRMSAINTRLVNIENNSVGLSWGTVNEEYLRLSQSMSSSEQQVHDSLNVQANCQWQAGGGDWPLGNAPIDMSNMQERLGVVWQQIKLIGRNPLNFGLSVSNRELARMRGQLGQAVQEQELLNVAVADMDAQAANGAYWQLSRTVSGLERYIQDNLEAQENFNRCIEEGLRSFSDFDGRLDRTVKAYWKLSGLCLNVGLGEETSGAAFNVPANTGAQQGAFAGNMGMSDYYREITSQLLEIQSWCDVFTIISNMPLSNVSQLQENIAALQEQVGQRLYPGITMLVDVFLNNWPAIVSIVQVITSDLQFMLGVLNWLLQAAFAVGSVIAENWSWIAPIVYGAAVALGLYKIATIASNIQKGIAVVVAYAHTAAVEAETRAELALTAAQHGFNAALLASPITWIIAGIIAGVVALTAFCAWLAHTSDAAQTTFGAVVGCLNVVWRFLVNLAQTAVNAGLAIWNAFWACAGNVGIAFENTFASIKGWFYGLVSNVLGGIAKIAEALNKLPFVEFDYSGLTARADAYANKAAQAASQQKEYVDVGAAFSQGWHTFEVFQEGWVSEAFAQGANWGDNLNLFGVQELDMSAYEMLNKGNWDNMDSSLQEIAANTGNMAHELAMTDEDLKYMRDIAERETVNRYTTAEIVVNMGGITNQVNKMEDLDGIITHLVDGVNEAVEIAAEGVHM